jgi:hypothetical protein
MLMKKMEVLLLNTLSSRLKDKAPKMPPKGMIPINIACARDDLIVI